MIIFEIVNSLGLLFAASFTGWAALSASKAAKATRDSVSAALAIAETNNRPWLYSCEIGIKNLYAEENSSDSEDPESYYVDVDFFALLKNSGTTPAVNTRLQVKLLDRYFPDIAIAYVENGDSLSSGKAQAELLLGPGLIGPNTSISHRERVSCYILESKHGQRYKYEPSVELFLYIGIEYLQGNRTDRTFRTIQVYRIGAPMTNSDGDDLFMGSFVRMPLNIERVIRENQDTHCQQVASLFL